MINESNRKGLNRIIQTIMLSDNVKSFPYSLRVMQSVFPNDEIQMLTKHVNAEKCRTKPLTKVSAFCSKL